MTYSVPCLLWNLFNDKRLQHARGPDHFMSAKVQDKLKCYTYLRQFREMRDLTKDF